MFTWIRTRRTYGTTEELIDQHRALVIHELLHALGATAPPPLLSPSSLDARSRTTPLPPPPPTAPSTLTAPLHA